MELVLYCPEYGFYEKEKDNVGKGGHFYTSVSVGSLFGELLAFQFARWFDECSELPALQLIEAGAHDGKLAGDILGWLQSNRPEVFARTEYRIIEPSARRRDWQKQTLSKFSERIGWLEAFPNQQSAIGNRQFTIAFSNELLDAMPVRRFGWDQGARSWFEWGVGVEGEGFVWVRQPGGIDSESLGLPSAPELLDVLPDGCVCEVSPAAEHWWSEAARNLGRGKLLTFDYGFDSDEPVSAARISGTLRAFQNHKQVVDILAAPGEQDITAHVDFKRIEAAGRAAGLATEFQERQEKFLTRVAAEAWKADSRFGGWDPKRTRQFQTLTHPEHLGRNFRVLVQSRD